MRRRKLHFRGGAHPLHPPPRSAPELIPSLSVVMESFGMCKSSVKDTRIALKRKITIIIRTLFSPAPELFQWRKWRPSALVIIISLLLLHTVSRCVERAKTKSHVNPPNWKIDENFRQQVYRRTHIHHVNEHTKNLKITEAPTSPMRF